MAVNPNFTNANKTTTYWASGVGGSSNFPTGITIGQNPPAVFSITGIDYNNNLPTITDLSGNTEGLVAYSFKAIDSVGKTGILAPDNITFQQSQSGTGRTMVTINDGALGATNNNYFNLLGLSTINAGTDTANAVTLMSSLKGTFPSCFS